VRPAELDKGRSRAGSGDAPATGASDLNNDLKVLIDDLAYPVVSTNLTADSLQGRGIHSLEVPWEAPFMGRARRIELQAGGESRPIKVLSARFRDGNQRVAFQYE
jgi:hypothetical protein